MANGAFKFKDNSGNVVSFISGSGSNISFSGGTLDLSGMTGLTLGNLTLSGTTQNAISASHAASYLLTSSFNTYSGTTDTVIGTLQTSTSSLNSFTSSATSRLSSIETSTGSLNTFTSSATTRLNSIEGVSGSYATTGSNLFKGNQTISGSIIPAVDNAYDLGSVTHQFRDLYLSSASLYIDGTKVLGSTAQELQITTDTGQSFKILEAGSDNITLQSADGNIELKSSGGGDVILDPTTGVIALKGTTTLYAGNKILSSDGNAIQIGNSATITGSLIVTGFIETQELRTTYISSSILYRSGSTKFGDELSDTHTFTGSLLVSGTISVPGSGLISGSSQILNGSGVFSGSAQLPSGIVSSSAQTIANLPSGVVSGSAQTIANLPSGTVSGSVQVDVMSTTNIARLATTGSNTFTSNQIVSGSVYISSGSYFNVGRGADNSYPFNVTSQFAKTDTSGRGLMFLGSNESIATNPFGLVVTVTGAASLAGRTVTMGTTDFGLANGGTLNLNNTLYVTGSNIGIGTSTPNASLTVSGGAISFPSNMSSGFVGYSLFQNGSKLTIAGGSGGIQLNNTANSAGLVSLFDNGNFLIGTTGTDGGYKLDVNGTGRFSGDLYIDNSSALGYSRLWLRNSGASNTNYLIGVGGSTSARANLFYINNTTSDTTLFSMTSTGAATFSAKVSAKGGSASGGYYMDYQTDGSSRSFRVSSEHLVYADFVIQRSTTRTGTTYEDLLYFDANRAATFSSSITAGGAVIANVASGFRSNTYQGGLNPIWCFNTAPAYGMGYYQVNTDILGIGMDAIGFFFSNTSAPQFFVKANGGAYFENSVGIGAKFPRTRLQVTPASNAETPVLGTATGAVTFTSANTNYGIQFNSTSDGSYFIQSQRFDASATAYALGLNPVGGYVYLGKGWGAANHRINLEVAQGNNILVVSAYAGASNDSVLIRAASGANPNDAGTTMGVTTNSATGRSISAGGTINASGNDYAEYMLKAVTDNISKGDIVGIDNEGLLTNIFSDSVSFVVKSTNPSYVGGDAWGTVVGKRPERTTDQTEEEFAPILAEFEAKLEVERQKVDRIAFSGQVPVNVTGSTVGDYIIPISTEDGKITGQTITNPTFEQYQISVGKVWKIMEDGRAFIAVKIG